MSTEGGFGDPKFSIYDFSRDGIFDVAALISQRNVGKLIEGIWRYNGVSRAGRRMDLLIAYGVGQIYVKKYRK